ncbi:hypothetical protein FJY63_13375 [Candidatus Sumerlaeota bacterium]|nr:hypothetical protein [Candidatus Sumerlaeota bacterium]
MSSKKMIQEKAGDWLSGNRRDFVRRAGAIGLAGAASWLVCESNNATSAAQPSQSEKTSVLPTITIAGKAVTRLVAGGNPTTGSSQPSPHVAQHMNEYFTSERIADYLIRCEQVGINTFQHSAADKVREGIRLARERGSRIQWICLTSGGGSEPPLEKILEIKPIAIAHHGGVTDRLFRDGKQDAIGDFIKKIHDKGVPAGVSSHKPENIRAVEEKNWGNDFFMTCFYNVVRSKEEMKRQFGAVPVDSLSFWADDPDAMTAVVRQSRKPCLGFKILAAGRLCSSPATVEQAFRYAFEHIKPTDGVIVGMYPRFSDEPAQNAALARKHGRPA